MTDNQADHGRRSSRGKLAVAAIFRRAPVIVRDDTTVTPCVSTTAPETEFVTLGCESPDVWISPVTRFN